MECFILKDGVECKAGLNDLFPLIREELMTLFQYFLKDVLNSDIILSAALAFLSDEIKKMVYRNMSVRNSGRLKKETRYAESE